VAGDDDRLEEIAASVLDGTDVDWKTAESKVDGAERPLVEHLKVVAALAVVHRLPATWGHLQLIERIGRGTFGEVYRAWDPRLDREVALKLLPTADTGGKEPSFAIPEGRLLARVGHNNIVTIYGAEQIGDRIGLWMELVRGRTLEQRLREGTRFTAGEAGRIGGDLCSAVAAVHEAGLLHRDIKAHNVMLAHDDRVVLMDFGTGRELHNGLISDLAGTPLYLAPEVLDGKPATVQSDIYSLGVLLFHVLTGRYPVEGPTVGDIRAAHNAGAVANLRGTRPDVPPRLARAIERAIDPVADRRFPNAAAFGAALRDAPVGMARRQMIAGATATAVVLATGALAWRGRGRVTPGEVPTIAVLPFEAAERTAGSEEFADGLTDEIQRSLAVIQGLALRSSSSSFAFKNRPRDLRQVASQLGVDFVLEGSVARTGDTVHIQATFTRVADAAVLWKDRFDREAMALPAALDDISRAIVNELRVTLGQGQRRYSIEPDLYYKFLHARAFHGRRGPENSARAAELFQQVVSSAPDYAPAWAGLASALAQLSRPSTGEEIIPPDPRLGPAALKALQLDPLLAEAHAALANMYAHDRDWVNARMSFLKALALNPTLTEIHNDFVLGVLMPIGDTREAVRQLEAARIVDPLSLDVRRTEAHVFIEAGRYTDAIENCRWIRQHDPAFPFVDVWLGRALYFSGRFDEAQEALERAGPQYFGYLGYLLAISGRRADAEALAARNPDAPSRTMLIYAGLGDKDRAFEGLAHTAEINWWRAATWLHRPEMALLRGDPRMPALRRKLRLPD
jgi:serine/threonine-protein kinase